MSLVRASAPLPGLQPGRVAPTARRTKDQSDDARQALRGLRIRAPVTGFFKALPRGHADAMDVLPRGLTWTDPMVINHLRAVLYHWMNDSRQPPTIRQFTSLYKWGRRRLSGMLYSTPRWAPVELQEYADRMISYMRGRGVTQTSAGHEEWRGHRSGAYLIQGIDGGPIKIGFSDDVASRLRSLQSGSPVRLRVLCVMAGTMSLESELHKRFAAWRLHGEWFQPTPQILALVPE